MPWPDRDELITATIHTALRAGDASGPTRPFTNRRAHELLRPVRAQPGAWCPGDLAVALGGDRRFRRGTPPTRLRRPPSVTRGTPAGGC